MRTSTDVHPFEVFFEDGKYYIFAPEGCVLVAGKVVEIADAENGNVELDLDIDDLPECLYAHVTADSDATGGYKVEFDGEDEKEGAKWSFRVMSFGSAENDGDQYDIATSVVCLGGGGGHPGPYEPIFEDGVLSDVGAGLYPFGRNFYSYVTIDSSAEVSDGFIGIEITHPQGSSTTPSAVIKKIADTEGAFVNTNLNKTVLPLYFLKDCEIETDYRCLMALAVRE